VENSVARTAPRVDGKSVCIYLLRSMHSLCQRLNGRDSPCWDAHQWLWCAWLRQIVTHMEQCMIQPQPAVGRDWRESVT
jgi:hypothetical protein